MGPGERGRCGTMSSLLRLNAIAATAATMCTQKLGCVLAMLAMPSNAYPKDRATRRSRPEGATNWASLTGKPKRPKGVLLVLAHSALVIFVFVIVAKDVQDAVRHQIPDLSMDRVTELLGLHRRRGK